MREQSRSVPACRTLAKSTAEAWAMQLDIKSAASSARALVAKRGLDHIVGRRKYRLSPSKLAARRFPGFHYTRRSCGTAVPVGTGDYQIRTTNLQSINVVIEWTLSCCVYSAQTTAVESAAIAGSPQGSNWPTHDTRKRGAVAVPRAIPHHQHQQHQQGSSVSGAYKV